MNWKSILTIIIVICLAYTASGQGKDSKPVTISGKVLNSDKMPVAGAVFYIDNVRTSYKTNTNGTYRIKVSPEALRLEVRSSVYGSAESLINGQRKINFMLGTQPDDKESVPGIAEQNESSKEQISSPVRKRAKKMNTYNNIYQMIQAEVSGVVVSGKRIQIRQGHSFLGSGDPLLVVNGVIVNSIDYVSPLEVKSISVLKGSAASIYGLQGTNGVISITLLNGSEAQ
jgi:TonB-dependent starch-binding outer membrane protein SusC